MAYHVIDSLDPHITLLGLINEFMLLGPFLLWAGLKEFSFIIVYYYLPSLELLELFSKEWSFTYSFQFLFDKLYRWWNAWDLLLVYPY